MAILKWGAENSRFPIYYSDCYENRHAKLGHRLSGDILWLSETLIKLGGTSKDAPDIPLPPQKGILRKA